MDVHRLRALVEIIRRDYKTAKINDEFAQVVNTLQQWANTPSADTGKAFSQKLEDLRKALAASRVHELQPLQRRMLREIGGERFTGRNLADEIERASKESTTPGDALQQVQQLHAGYSKFLESLNQLSTTLDALGVKPHKPQEGLEEVSVILPDEVTKRELSELEELVHDWNIAVGHVQELVTGRGTPLRVVSLSSGSLVLTLGVVYGVASATLKLVNQSLDAYKKVCEIRKIQEEVRGLKLGNDAVELLKQKEKESAEQSVEEIAVAIVREFASKDNGGRAHPERLVQMRKTVTFVLKQIDKGVEIEILLPPPPEPTAEEQKEGKPAVDPIRQEIKLAPRKWKELKREPAPILQLEEPDLDGSAAPPHNGEKLKPDTSAGASAAAG